MFNKHKENMWKKIMVFQNDLYLFDRFFSQTRLVYGWSTEYVLLRTVSHDTAPRLINAANSLNRMIQFLSAKYVMKWGAYLASIDDL